MVFTMTSNIDIINNCFLDTVHWDEFKISRSNIWAALEFVYDKLTKAHDKASLSCIISHTIPEARFVAYIAYKSVKKYHPEIEMTMMDDMVAEYNKFKYIIPEINDSEAWKNSVLNQFINSVK